MQNQLFSPVQLNFKEKQREFKKEFVKTFIERLENINAVAVGRKFAVVEYSITEPIVKTAIETFMSSAACGIPLIGPFAATFISSVPGSIYEKMKSDKLTSQSEEFNNKLVEYGSSKMEEIIDEVSHELTRIFEYQIAVVRDLTEAAKLGKYAAEKIYSSAESSSFESKSTNFDRDSLIASLFKYEKEFFLEKVVSKVIGAGGGNIQTVIPIKKSRGDKFIAWKCTEIFVKVGLRVELPNGQTEYGIQPKVTSAIPTCGFRSNVFKWDNESNQFVLSEFDHGYTIIVSSDEVFASSLHVNYSQYYRQVHQSQLDEFLRQSSRSIKPKNFAHYIREQSTAIHDIHPVLRNVSFPPGSELTFADFSNTDMTRISMSQCQSTQCIYNEARFASAQISNTVMKNSWFISADMRGSVFTNVDLQGDNSLTKANFCNSIVDEDINLADNYSFGQAITEHALVLTKKVLFTATMKIQNLESMMTKLVEAKDKKEAELTEKLLSIEHEMEKVKQQKQRSLHPYSSDDPYFYNVRDAVDDFCGRQDSLSQLSSYFNQHEQSYAIAVVAADGGIGKTQLILEYVFQNKEKYGKENMERIYWVTAETIESLSASFKDFAECLNINVENRTDKAILKDVQKKMNTKLYNTLFIFDNVDNMKLIKDYLPQASSKHHTIITTRIKENWSSDYFMLALQPFTVQEAHDYITSQINDASDDDIHMMSELFNNVPLALSQAIAHTKEYGLSFHEYLLCYDRIENLSHADRSLYVTVLLSLEELEGKYSVAIDIMKICGFLFADGIPVIIFASLLSSEDELLKMILLLETNNLLKRKIDVNGVWRVYIHRLVQDVMREKVRQANQLDRILMKANNLVSSCMVPHVTFDIKEVLSKNQVMLPYALSLISHYEEYEASNFKVDKYELSSLNKYKFTSSVMELYSGCARYYLYTSNIAQATTMMMTCSKQCDKYMNNNVKDVTVTNVFYWMASCDSTSCEYEKALQKYQMCLASYEDIFGGSHPTVADAILCVANIYAEKGLLDKAMTMYIDATTIYEQLYGHNHAAIANCLSNKAYINIKLGAYEKALELYLEALSIREGLYGRKHAAIGNSLNQIANLYSDNALLDKAMESYQECLSIFEQVYDHNHASVATAICNIANMHARRGSYDKARELHAEALSIYESVYGHEHSTTADCLACVADIHYSQGSYNQAMYIYVDVLRIYEEIHGHNHASVAYSLSNIGNVHNCMGQFEKALEMHNEAYKLRVALYGHNHHDVASSINNLANVYTVQGSFDKAMEMYQEAVGINDAVYGHDHSSVATVISNMASIYFRRAAFDNSMELYTEVLRIRRKLYGDNHADVCSTLNKIAEIQMKRGQNDKAMETYNNTLPILEKIYGHDHEDVASTMIWIAEIHQQNHALELAMTMYREAMRIRENVYGHNHGTIAACLNKIANALLDQNQFDESMKANEESLKIFVAIYGENHPSVATCHCNIGNVYHSQKLFDQAIASYLQATKVYEAVYGHNHYDVASAISNLANVYCDQGLFDKAIVMYNDALHINEEIFGHHHGNVAIILGNIASLYADQGSRSKAIEIYKQVLEVCIAVEGKKSTGATDCMIKIANQNYHAEMYQQAYQYYKEVLPILEELFGNDHQKVTSAMSIIKDIERNHRSAAVMNNDNRSSSDSNNRLTSGDNAVVSRSDKCCNIV